jgi:uncharacterized repeat protein (TIGR02543 family)
MNSTLALLVIPGAINPPLGFSYAEASVPLPDGATTTYSVAYAGNGNDGGNVPVDSNAYAPDDVVTVLGNVNGLSKVGYQFVGWNTAADGSGQAVQVGAMFAIEANTTLYAQWTSAITASANGMITLDSTAATFSINKPIWMAQLILIGGTAAGAFELKEGVNGSGLADGSGQTIARGYLAIGQTVIIDFGARPVYADKGLKLSSLPAGAKVRVILA